MKYIRYAGGLIAVVTAFTFFACNKSSNPVTPSAPVRTFSFVVGNSFVFDTWSLDTLTGAKIPSSMSIVHESIKDSGLTIDGVSGVYMAIDSSFTTTDSLFLIDTIYYATTSTSISSYGLVASMMNSVSGLPFTIPRKWNKIADNGNGGTWIADTTSIGISVPYNGTNIPVTIATNITGRDGGDSTLNISGSSLLGDHAVDSGSVNVTGTIIIPLTLGTMPLIFHVYTTYQPTVIARIYAPPQKFTSSLYPALDFSLSGTERDLISWSGK